MPLQSDIIDRVRADYSRRESPAALDELSASGVRGRVARCLVLAAGGSLECLRELIRMAVIDCRDAIVAGEYDAAMQQVRDLRVSFLIDSPGDFWIAETAVTADKHGFRLADIDSRPATVGPFDYTSDRSEGRATFSNGASTVAVQKRDRQWSVSASGDDLRPFGLEQAFDEEEQFRVQLDYYLSVKSCRTSG